MSFSKVKIFNLALNHLGVSAVIQKGIEESPTAVLMNNFYEVARDTVLEAHEWSFANAFEELAVASEDSPNPNFRYAFKFPNDCIAPRAIIDTADNKEKKFEPAVDKTGAKIILTNSNPCILRFTKRVTNETYFTASFVNALAFYLAYLSAQSVVGSANKKNTNLQDYQFAIRQAIVTDARKTQIHDEDEKDFTDLR